MPMQDNRNRMKPALVRDYSGPMVPFVSRSRSNAFGVEFGGKTFLFASGPGGGANAYAATYAVYDWTTGVLTEYSGASKPAGNVNHKDPSGGLFVTSTGAILCYTGAGTDSNYSIYRTTLSTLPVWTRAYNLADLPETAASDRPTMFAENESGVILAVTYNGADADADCGSAILRSEDDGVTWERITTFDRSTYHPRHMHFVQYDKYRKVFWVGGGDGLGASKVAYTADGRTFTPLPHTWQSVGVIRLPGGLMLCSDHNTYTYSIYRIPGRTLEELAAYPLDVTNTEHIAFDPKVNHPVAPGGSAINIGYAWGGWHDDELGVTWTAFDSSGGLAGILAGSCNEDGRSGTWHVIDWDTGGYFKTFGDVCMPNESLSSWSGWMVTQPKTGYGFRWRVVPPNAAFHVDAVAGTLWGRGTEAYPLARLPETWQRLDGKRFVLDADYPHNVSAGTPGLLVDRGAHTLGAAVSGTLAVGESSDPLSSGTTATNWSDFVAGTGAAVTWGDAGPATPPPLGGTCVKCVAGAVSGNYAYTRRASTGLTAAANGQDHWVEFYAYLDEATWRGAMELLGWVNHGTLRLTAQAGLDGVTRIVPYFVDPGAIPLYPDPWAQVGLTLQAWNHVKARLRADDTNGPFSGELDVWVNHVLAFSMRGLRTKAAGTNLHSFAVGPVNRASTGTRTVYLQGCKMVSGASAFDTSKPGAVVLRGARQRVRPDGTASAA